MMFMLKRPRARIIPKRMPRKMVVAMEKLKETRLRGRK